MKKRKITLLIDQDDVLAEYISGVTEAYNAKYGTNKKASDCITWNLYNIFGEEVDTVMHEPELFRHLKPVVHALEVFERLYKSNLFEMYIVTAAQSCSVEAKHQWLKEFMPYFPHERVIICRKKNMIRGDFLLDDGMHNIEDFSTTGGTPIIFERPHNVDCGEHYYRVKNWLEFESLIMKLCYPELVAQQNEQEQEAI